MSTVLKEAQPDEVSDRLLEEALEACGRVAKSLGDTERAMQAWNAALLLKRVRRPEVTERLEAEQLARLHESRIG